MTPAAIHSAQVRAHDLVMNYQRSGTGPLLLVLGADSAHNLWPELPELLSEHFKVIIPELPPGGGQDPAGWLRCLLEGLGAERIPVLAGGQHCETALALALGDGDSVTHLVLVPSAPDVFPSETAESALPASAGGVDKQGSRLYVLSPRHSVREAAERITQFLERAQRTG